MEFVIPEFWEIAGLFGIAVVFLGTSAIACVKSNYGTNILKYLAYELNGKKVVLDLENIIDRENSMNRNELCDETVDLFFQESIRYHLHLDIDSMRDIEGIGYEHKGVNGHVLKIINRNGEDQKFTTDDFNVLVNDIVDKNMKQLQDKLILYSWVFVAVGFFLQGASYFVQHFVV